MTQKSFDDVYWDFVNSAAAIVAKIPTPAQAFIVAGATLGARVAFGNETLEASAVAAGLTASIAMLTALGVCDITKQQESEDLRKAAAVSGVTFGALSLLQASLLTGPA